MKHKSRRFGLPLKRKRLGKTNYRSRLEMLKSKKLRFVVRRSLKNILIQIVQYHPAGDRIVVTATTKELQRDFGWDSARRNTPAAYLVGLLVGMKAKAQHIQEAILDLGLQEATRGSLIFAAVKGAVDSGLNIPHNPEVMPKEDRIQGKHIKFKNTSFDKVKAAILQYAPQKKERTKGQK